MIVNPGNILPIYDNIRDQWRFRWGHETFGVIADLENLIPFQLKVPDGYILESWWLVKVDGTEVFELDVAQLDRVADAAGTWKWYTWFANTPIGPELACGRYYMRFDTGRAEYFSEVLTLENLTGYENASLVASCDGNEVTLSAFDTLNTDLSYQSIQQLDDDGVTWTEVGSNTYTVPNDTVGPTETYRFRRVVRTAGGSYLTTYYTLYFEVLSACDTYLLAPYNTDNWSATPNRAKLVFSNSIDTAAVIYSTSYEQWCYLDAYMDFPEASVENETLIDGNGRVRILSSNAKERTVFEFPRVPDFWVGVFGYLPFLSSKTIRFDELADTHTMEEVEFTFRDQEDGYYSVGRLSYRAQQYFDQSCDAPYELISPES